MTLLPDQLLHGHHVLGFDARERYVPRDAMFTADRVQTFLIKDDVDKPLSTDVIVWPTVFQNANVERAHRSAFGLGNAGIPLPLCTGPLQDLWSSLFELDRHLLENAASSQGDVTTIAISVDDTWRSPLGNQPLAWGEAEPAELGAGWELFGLDVSDRFLVSALMNFSYVSGTQERTRADWAHHLNRWHLFDDPDVAAAFARASDARISKRGPFFVYGLWGRTRP